jgi:hypothetical protein
MYPVRSDLSSQTPSVIVNADSLHVKKSETTTQQTRFLSELMAQQLSGSSSACLYGVERIRDFVRTRRGSNGNWHFRVYRHWGLVLTDVLFILRIGSLSKDYLTCVR